MNEDEIKISDRVWAQYESVRRSGQTNMYLRFKVEEIAKENEFYDLLNAIDDGLYPKIIKFYDEEKIEELDIEIPECEQVDIEVKE